MRRIREHLTYANVMATIAVFLVLSGGTAVALSGSNTVFSDDIVDDQVFSADVRNDTLSGGGLAAGDLRSGSVGTSEVALNSLAAADLAASSVGTSEAVDNSLTGADIAESSLGEVPFADFADFADSADFANAANSAEIAETTTFANNSGLLDGLDSTEFARLVVGGAYVALPVQTSAGAPPAADCDVVGEAGRAVYGAADDILWVCGGGTWRGH